MFKSHVEGSGGDTRGERYPGEWWSDTAEKYKTNVMAEANVSLERNKWLRSLEKIT